MFKSIHYFVLAVVIFTSTFRIPNAHGQSLLYFAAGSNHSNAHADKKPPKNEKEALLEQFCSQIFFTKIIQDDIESKLSKEGIYYPNIELLRKLEPSAIPIAMEESTALTLERFEIEQALSRGLGLLLIVGGTTFIVLAPMLASEPNFKSWSSRLKMRAIGSYALATVLLFGGGLFILFDSQNISELDYGSTMALNEALEEYKQTLENFILANNKNC